MASEDPTISHVVDAALLKRIAENGAKDALAKHSGGGHPPGMDDLERRVGRLETILDQMVPTLARIDERLKAVATKDDLVGVRQDISKVGERVAKVEGAVDKLPTTLHLLGFIVSVLALAGIAKFLHL